MASSDRPRLLNLSNNEVIQITTEKILVGRSLKADYVISGQAISRIHFSIEKTDGVWALHDHSTNGTYVNNVIIKSRSKTLKSGDTIRFLEGTVSLKFELPSDPSPTTNSEPNPDFIVSVTNGDDVPSVSNDHSYERREEPRSETETLVDLTSPEGSPSTSGSAKVATKRNMSSADGEVPTKKDKVLEESLDQSKIQCVLESSDLECTICQELFIKAATLNCSHSFCSSCIHRWRNQRNHCPICRRPIESINPSMILDNIVKKLVVLMDDETREQRDKLVKERPAEIPVAGPTSSDTYSLTDLTDSDDLEEDDLEEEYDDDDDDLEDDDDFEEEISWETWGEFYPEIIGDYHHNDYY